MTSQPNSSKIEEFIQELSGFAQTAENTLTLIESDMESKKNEFEFFANKMFAIRGTAQQLNLPHIAHIAGLGEEISIKAQNADSRPKIRKCIGSLWDALGTIKYLLQHPADATTDEQNILINRLEDTLRRLGGARPTVSESEVEDLLKQRD